MNKYEILSQIDNGSYASVYRARLISTGQQVAIKKMKKKLVEAQKLQLRELRILQNCKHPCLTELKQWFISSQGVLYLVFQYFEQNLLNLYQRLKKKRKKNFNQKEIKCVIYQCLLGLSYLHSQRIIHRDIKPQNILINKSSRKVKLTDFGLSKIVDNSDMTQYVSTRWYRAPQLVLMSRSYDFSIDVFAIGCLVVQLLQSKQAFAGSNNIDQLDKIFSVLGTPSYQQWPQGYSLAIKNNINFKIYRKRSLKEVLLSHSEQLVDLAQKMLQINPKNRSEAKDLLKHPYFNDISNYLPAEVNSIRIPPPLTMIRQESSIDYHLSQARRNSQLSRQKQLKSNQLRNITVRRNSNLAPQIKKLHINLRSMEMTPSSSVDNFSRSLNKDYVQKRFEAKPLHYVSVSPMKSQHESPFFVRHSKEEDRGEQYFPLRRMRKDQSPGSQDLRIVKIQSRQSLLKPTLR